MKQQPKRETRKIYQSEPSKKGYSYSIHSPIPTKEEIEYFNNNKSIFPEEKFEEYINLVIRIYDRISLEEGDTLHKEIEPETLLKENSLSKPKQDKLF